MDAQTQTSLASQLGISHGWRRGAETCGAADMEEAMGRLHCDPIRATALHPAPMLSHNSEPNDWWVCSFWLKATISKLRGQ